VSFWQGRNVFVTGATGLLGAWLVEELLRRGAVVTTLVRDFNPRARPIAEGFLERTNVVRGALADQGTLLRVLAQYEVDTVFHLGAQALVGTALRAPVATFEANVQGTWNLLEACRRCAGLVRRVIVASSDKAYGAHESLPYGEDAPLQGRAPYDVSKACADLIATSYFCTYGVPVAVTRCGNLYGAGDLHWSRLVPGTIRAALRGEAPLIRSNGKLERDWLYARDAVTATLLLGERLESDGLAGEAFNFGTGRPAAVLEVVDLVLRLCGATHLRPVILDAAPHEIPRQTLSSAKAERVLGWRAAHSLEAGLRETIPWYRARPECRPAGDPSRHGPS
jgi:CDP-glucose 4,6-dehydratase